MRDAYSISIRVESNDFTRKKGRIYHDNLEKFIKKFEIKTPRETLTQCLNIHSSYFALVDEIQAETVIDLIELKFLIDISKPTISTLKKAKRGVEDLGDDNGTAGKIQEKIKDIISFVIELDKSLITDNLPDSKIHFTKHFIGIISSIIGMDRLYFYPKKIFSWIIGFWFPISLILFIYNYILSETLFIDSLILKIFAMGGISIPFWYFMIFNPLETGGYWKFRKQNTMQRNVNALVLSIKNDLRIFRLRF